MNTIICSNIKKNYAHKQILHDVSLQLQSNHITGLLGANGAGKSTLIKSLLRLIQINAGEINGLEHKKIGYLPEMVSLPSSSTPWQLIQLALSFKQSDANKTADLLQMVNIQDNKWHQPLRTFSKGMRQRVALAYALAGNPDWVILDEPMSGLDALGRRETLHIIKTIHQQGTGILICSHIVPDLVRICDDVLIISKGSIIKKQAIEQHSMQEAEALENFLAEIEENNHGETL